MGSTGQIYACFKIKTRAKKGGKKKVNGYDEDTRIKITILKTDHERYGVTVNAPFSGCYYPIS